MLPIIIEDMIKNLTNTQIHVDKRQFYYTTLLNIKGAVDKAIVKYENEKNFKN